MYHHGVLSLPRTLIGPGRHGSLSEARSTKSAIHIVEDVGQEGRFTLTYTISGKARQVEIPHIALNTTSGEYAFSCDRTSPEEAQKELEELIAIKPTSAPEPNRYMPRVLDKFVHKQIMVGCLAKRLSIAWHMLPETNLAILN